ncbi:MAG TPA: hypothetical protein VKN82_06670 [Desulfohalobiaceae bacterium]|nr:hypothetical protein [Desulfohalobiaceae bacterium]
MINKDKLMQDLYDRDGQLMGVWISAPLWHQIENRVEKELQNALTSLQGEAPAKDIKEPLADWDLLKKYWDFKYPVDMDVYCEYCGNQTKNWEQDNPRKFLLKAASLGGLVTFQCVHCSSRILKKHFNDHIKVELMTTTK